VTAAGFTTPLTTEEFEALSEQDQLCVIYDGLCETYDHLVGKLAVYQAAIDDAHVETKISASRWRRLVG